MMVTSTRVTGIANRSQMNDNLVMRRLPQIVLFVSMAGTCWLGMMIVHEFGHVMAAWLNGIRVTRVVLHPLAFSRTDLAVHPHPLSVIWAGALVGAMLPLVVWACAHWLKLPGRHGLRFFAGFCLIANGAYLAVGMFDRAGDAGDLLRQGVARWQLWAFGAIVIPAGFLIWHRLGVQFGLGPKAVPVKTKQAWFSAGLFAAVVLAELAFSARHW